MFEFIDKIIYLLSLYLAWPIMHKILFEKRRKAKHLMPDILRTIILSCFHIICGVTTATNILMPILMLSAYYLLFLLEYRVMQKSLLIEFAFTYALTVIISILSIPLAILLYCLCIVLTNGSITPDSIYGIPFIVITVIRCIILFTVYVLMWSKLKHRNLSILSAKAPLRIFAIISVLYLASYIFIRIPNHELPVTSEASFIWATFVLCISLALFITSAMREHEVLTDHERAEAEIQEKTAQLSETTDAMYYLKSENHKLNKALPALEDKVASLEAAASTILRPASDMEAAMEIAAGVERQKRGLQALRKEKEAESRKDHFEIELDLDTGLALVDTYLEYQSKCMLEQGVMFDCIISEKPDCNKLGLNEPDFHQIVANLLSNAAHAAQRQSTGRKAVIFTMGPQGDAYQIKITDSGEPFPPHILQNLGRMGNTTDGNGVGYTAVLTLLRKCGGSLFIEEYISPTWSGLTKRVVVSFDGRGRVAVLSPGAPEALKNGRGVAELLAEAEYRP